MSDEQSTPFGRADSTASLVARLRAGNADAAAVLDQIYRDALVRFCWGYLGHMDEAEDAVQDIFCKVLATDSVPDGFRAWLYRIARNHCLNLVRDRARRKDDGALPAASQIHEALTGQLTRLVHGEQHSRMIELVRGLPDTEREVLRLRYVEELSRPEIAEVLGTTESVVKSRLFVGLKRLREDLSAPLDEPPGEQRKM